MVSPHRSLMYCISNNGLCVAAVGPSAAKASAVVARTAHRLAAAAALAAVRSVVIIIVIIRATKIKLNPPNFGSFPSLLRLFPC